MAYDTDQDPAALAFEGLREDIALVLAAIKGMTAVREQVPDYSPTLAEITRSQKAALDGLARIECSPAIGLSPEAMVTELVKASEVIRSEDRRMLHEARDTITRSVGHIDGIVERGQAADRQFKQKMWWAAGGIVVGALFMAILPDMVIHALPESWHIPEQMAAKSIGLDMADAGERLSRVAGKLNAGETAPPEGAAMEHAATPPLRRRKLD